MQDPSFIDTRWWITVVEIPALAALFWLMWRNRNDAQAAASECRDGLASQREQLAAYKLEVAKNYVSMPYLKEVERRLTAHLVRIEDKLDRGERQAHGGRA